MDRRDLAGLLTPRRFLPIFCALYIIGAVGAAVVSVRLRPSRQLFVADGFGYYAFLPAIFTNRSLDFTEIYAEPEAAQFTNFRSDFRTPAGLPENPFTVGPAILWSPGYLVARGLAAVGALGEAGRRPLGLPTQAVVWAWASLIGLAGLLVTYDMLRRRWGDVAAAAGLTLGFFGTPVLAYLLVETGFSHSAAFAVLAAYAWCIDRLDEKPGCPRLATAAGLLLGLAVAIRPTLLAAGLLFAIVWFRGRSQPTARPVVWLATFGAPLLIVGSLQFIVWRLLYGSFWPDLSNTSWGQLDPAHPHILEVLFSLNHGLFSWTPLWLMGALGLGLLARDRPAWLTGVALLLVVHLLTIAVNPRWHGDGAFGQRKFVDVAVFFFLGIGAALPRLFAAARPVRAVAAIAGTLLVLLNLNLARRYYMKSIPQSGPITLRQLFGGS